jgi:dTDP-glucose 4,6-dehydratase
MLYEDFEYIEFNTTNLLMEIRNKTIFITGGTGFLGTLLLESFAYANDNLGLNSTALVLTRNQAAFAKKAPHLANHPNIQFLEGDIVSFGFPSGNYPYIIHAATETAHDLYDRDPLQAFDEIVFGMRRVLEFARQAKTQKILFTSSGSVYGKQLAHITSIPENYLGAPDLSGPYSVYGEGKRVSEMLCSIYARKYGIEIKIARCFAFIGPYMPLDKHLAIGNFIRDALRGGPIHVNGDGTPFRSYMYAADFVVWLWTILFRGESCRPYNVGSDVAIKIKDVARCVANEVSGGAEVIIAGVPDVSRPADRYVPDVCRASQELGLSIETSFSDAVHRTIRWYSNRK